MTETFDHSSSTANADSTRPTVRKRSATDVAGAGPVVAQTRAELRAAYAGLGDGDVGVVMTMGALHEGHATLIRQARARRGTSS